jgi:phosphatidylinositol alpha-1,6-mannosyltransferase
MMYGTLEDAYLAHFTQRVLRRRHVFFTHGNEVLTALRTPWRKPREALLASSCVIAVSRFTEELVRSAGVPRERIRIVHPGCDTRLFGPRIVTADVRARLTQERPHRRVIVTVGNLVERKGHDTVIRALAQLPPELSDVLYVIAGDGSYRRTLEDLAHSLGVAEKVVFLGRVATADLPLLYSMADLFVMVSRERLDACDVEGFGIVYIEAAACGTPAIGGRSGGVADAIVDGQTGMLVDPLDPAALAATMTRLLRDDATRRRLGDAAHRRAVGFTWANFTRSVADILEDVARD